VLKRWFHRVVLSRRWLTFVVLGLSFAVFGAGTLNLFVVFKANLGLLLEYGWMAAMDGGARQFVELVISGYASMAAYVIFKSCEYRLVHWLGDAPDSEPPPMEDKNEDRHPAG
jgi:hypothetical protein